MTKTPLQLIEDLKVATTKYIQAGKRLKDSRAKYLQSYNIRHHVKALMIRKIDKGTQGAKETEVLASDEFKNWMLALADLEMDMRGDQIDRDNQQAIIDVLRTEISLLKTEIRNLGG